MSSFPKPDSANVESKPDELVGNILNDRYAVIDLLNEGGMAKIYLGKHTVLGREVAIKVLKAGCAEDQDAIQRFMNEGRAAGTLGHPNIVECTDIGTTSNGKPYLVLELLVGHTLTDELMQRGPLAIGRAARIALRIADALAAAHAAGIVHRDLKSDNVFLAHKHGTSDFVKVLDFGISKFNYDSAGTQKGIMLGTPDFMAPEQVLDAGAVDARADIYALGVILYEMLSGRRPFQDIGFPMVLHAITNDAPPSLASLRNGMPPELIAVVEKAMSKRADDRAASMIDMVAALEPFADRVSIDSLTADRVLNPAGRTSFSPFSETLAGPLDDNRRLSTGGPAPISSTLHRLTEPNGRKPLTMVVGAVVAFSLFGVGAYGLSRPRGPVAPDASVVIAAPQTDMDVDFFVTPPNASVEVDGQIMEVKNGAFKLRGRPGTLRHVRAFLAGGYEARAEVIIGLAGAVPSRLEVVVPAPVSVSSVLAQPSVAVPLPRVKQPKVESNVPHLRDER
jgi:serine/threonine-protein kinase